jgi:hypothetical protein
MHSAPSYIGTGRSRQRAAWIGVGLAALLGGCAGGTPSIGADPVAVTGATDRGSEIAGGTGLSSADLLAIGSALGAGEAATGASWSNPASGSEGRITRVSAVTGPGGSDCRSFHTTVNAVDGVRAVTGIACRGGGPGFTVEGLAPADDATS